MLSQYAQTENFIIYDHKFEIRNSVVSNEWNSNDTVSKLYRISEFDTTYLLQFYIFQDVGGDCNNRYWNREKLIIEEDRIIFSTHFFQKDGIHDPIPEWRKQIYQVDTTGALNLVYDKYRYYYDKNWVDY
jgi:hypothetical protein